MTSKRVQAAIRDAFAASDIVRCEYCDHQIFRTGIHAAHPRRATGDHRTPLTRGGKDTRENVAISCYRCNARKGPLTEQEFLTLRHDPQRMARVINEWHARLNSHPATVYASRLDRKVAKRERRMSRLTERLRIPDPNCKRCAGTGRIRENARLERYCQCGILELTPEAQAAYIDGRKYA